MRYRQLLLTIMICVAASLSLPAAEQASIKRQEPERRGNFWEQRIDCSLPVRAGGRLVVRADAGSVTVNPGAAERLECQVRVRAQTSNEATARRYFEAYELSVRPLEGGGAYVSGRTPREGPRSIQAGAEFQIAIPERFNVDVETKGGAINVQKLDGELVAVTAGGSIRTGDVSGVTRVETAGGSIHLGNIGSRLEARTAGGGIRVGDVKGDAALETSGGEIAAGEIAGTMQAETAGGDIVLRGSGGPLQARTAGGQILIGESGGSVRAVTAGGSIRLLGSRGRMEIKTAGGSIDLWQIRSAVDAVTAAGRILAQIDPADKTFSACEFKNASGDVLVYVPPDLPLTIDAAIDAAAGHDIVTDFPLQIQREKDSFVQRTLRGHGDLNGGGEVLRIRTVSGNIEIRKLDARIQEQLKERQDSFWKQWEEKEAGHAQPRD
jgi:DUF4097 and DUF4098 domain-containing protein YvlB